MKTTIPVISIVILIALTLSAYAEPKTKVNITENTVSSLMIGLASDNVGLKSSSAYMIGELQLSKAVIPLMRILREDENEDMRIAVALALYKIGTPLAVNAVRQAAKFDENERVSKHCASFYSQYLRNKFTDEEINMNAAKTALK
jgi:HEAT repeat protein